MDKKQLEHFKKKLLNARQSIMNSGILSNNDDITIDAEDLSDEADLASQSTSQQLSFSIKEREMVKLRKIDRALEKIARGGYGVCEESGEAIELKRLENQPWTEYCLEVAEEKEREEQGHRRAY
jgi:DnaK suppressor protein